MRNAKEIGKHIIHRERKYPAENVPGRSCLDLAERDLKTVIINIFTN